MAQGSGTITGLNGITAVNAEGYSSIAFNITGTWIATLTIQATVDGTNWFTIPGFSSASQTTISSFTTNQAVVVNCAGYIQVQLIATAFTSGTINVAWGNGNTGQVTSTVVQPVIGSASSVVSSGYIANSQATWTSATSVNTALTLSTQGYGTVQFSIALPGPTTGGIIVFEVMDGLGANWYPITAYTPGTAGLPTSNNQYSLNGNVTNTWQANVSGYTSFRLRLSQAITGAGNVFVLVQGFALPTQGVVVATQANANALRIQLSDGNNNTSVSGGGALFVTHNPDVSNLGVTATAAAGSAVTATLPAVSGQFHYISSIEITAYTTLARTGTVTPILVTSTNLPGSNVWDFATTAAIGSTDVHFYSFPSLYKSSVVNTATTIVCPATTSIIWRVNVSYHTGP